MKLEKILYYLKDLHRVGALGDLDRKALGAAIKELERNAMPKPVSKNVAYVGLCDDTAVYWETDESTFYYNVDSHVMRFENMPVGSPRHATKDFLLGVDFALSSLVDTNSINSYFIPALKPGKRVVRVKA